MTKTESARYEQIDVTAIGDVQPSFVKGKAIFETAVVVPTNRPERMLEFIAAWRPQFHRNDVRLIVCEDAPTATPALVPTWAEHYAWPQIDGHLGNKASCIPRRSGGIRDFGFWLAGQDTSIDMIVSLDDDVLPDDMLPDGEDFLGQHWAALNNEHSLRWYRTTPFHVRGEPYHLAGVKPMLNHGLWRGMPDVDAYAQLRQPDIRWSGPSHSQSDLVPTGMYFSACGMNVAFRREAAPYYYFPVLPDGLKRWDDIWCGLIFKRVSDLFGWAVTSGYPCLKHERASNVLNNLRQEMLGYGINERMWQVVDSVSYRHSPMETYRAIANTIAAAFPELEHTVEAMHQWAGLWALPPTEYKIPPVSCMHELRGSPLAGSDGRDGRGRPVIYDIQCSSCKLWFPSK